MITFAPTLLGAKTAVWTIAGSTLALTGTANAMLVYRLSSLRAQTMRASAASKFLGSADPPHERAGQAREQEVCFPAPRARTGVRFSLVSYPVETSWIHGPFLPFVHHDAGVDDQMR